MNRCVLDASVIAAAFFKEELEEQASEFWKSIARLGLPEPR